MSGGGTVFVIGWRQCLFYLDVTIGSSMMMPVFVLSAFVLKIMSSHVPLSMSEYATVKKETFFSNKPIYEINVHHVLDSQV